MKKADFHDGGAMAVAAYAGYAAATAGGAGDATEANGAWVDRRPASRGPYMSAKLVIAYRAVLAEGATMTIAANMQDASDSSGTGAADFGSAYAAATVATGGTGGSTETGVIELDFDLGAAKEFVRCQFTPNLSAANTDTATLVATWVFFGSDRGPISASVV